MAGNVDTVLQLIEMLHNKCYPAAQQELQELTAFARQEGYADTSLSNWDVSYWSTRLRERKYEYEEEQLRPYFALTSVLEGLFGLAERLFGIQIRSADGQVQVWHPDVRYFKIYDSVSQKEIASFFLDPYSRPQDKKGGAWMNSCLDRSKVLNTLPVAYLICNGSPPVGDQPSLMTFREVETLFHGK